MYAYDYADNYIQKQYNEYWMLYTYFLRKFEMGFMINSITIPAIPAGFL